MSSSTLPAPTRIVTVTDPTTGLSSVWLKAPITLSPIRPGVPSLAGDVWISKEHVQDNLIQVDGATLTKAGTAEPNGSVVQIIDFAPGHSSPLHFTNSVDYMYIIKGVITLELTDGSFTELKEGDVLVQRGTAHAWHNKSTDWIRFLAVILPAKPILTVNGDKPKGLHFP